MYRMKELVSLLNKASKAYYNDNVSIMSDFAYDKLYDELVELENKYGTVLAGSPTQKVGYTVLSNLTKVKHDSKILSLDKTKDISKLKSFLGNESGVLSWKLDGLTIVLKYTDGKLVQAITRGNGEIGEDVTHNAYVFSNVPVKINYNGEVVIRGEAIISYSEFNKINDQLELVQQYKNPRNLCSGTVRQLNNEITSTRNVMFYAFSLVKADGIRLKKKSTALKWLSDYGFSVVENMKVSSENLESAIKKFHDNIEKNDFASDGLVLTFDDYEYSSSLGATSKFPKDSIAFKWKDEVAKTTITRVEWNTSRTGLINPVAIFEPVELEGTTVTKASVHNISVLEELKLGIGDCVKVYKANMIIPQIAENITKSASVIIPDTCPECNYETEIRITNEVKSLYCTNPNCRAQLIRSLMHFTSRNAFNIEGLSEKTLEKFVECGFLNNYTDIFDLKRYKDKMIELEGFKEKSVNNIIESIEKSKEIELYNFIYALGINHVGLSNAKLLCEHFNYDFDKTRNATQDTFIEIKGIGEITANSLYKYFHNEKNITLLNKVLEQIKINKPIEQSIKQLEGLVIVITGEINLFKNRKELQRKIEAHGGKVVTSVTRKTNFLINNNTTSESSKSKKANELGVPIISEESLVKKYNI